MRCIATLAIIVSWLAAASPVAARPAPPQPIVIKFSHSAGADTAKGKTIAHFKEVAEKRTGGAVRIEIFGNSQLYKDMEEYQALLLGAVHMIAPTTSTVGQKGVRDFDVFDLPYLFPNLKAVHTITQGPIGKSLLDKLPARGVVGLAYWDNGMRILTSNKPIATPADLQNKRMRGQYSKVFDTEMRVLGAKPLAAHFSDVKKGLDDDLFDGIEITLPNLYNLKLYTKQDYAVLTYHGYQGYVVLANKRFWEKLPPLIRKALESAMQETQSYADEMARRDGEDSLAKMIANGKPIFHTPTESEQATWHHASKRVYVAIDNWMNNDLIQSIYDEIGKLGDTEQVKILD
ncbi:MAG: DctP family TRAP transporter solute-binding subunit [Rhodospirillaceae bacterium]|nr:DctP family TRAP transporter solute-binding subunit [Rhodospirillales bacterium]